MTSLQSSSMAVEDEADVFEITDFTTASEWERFIARLEEILHEWKLVNSEPLPPALRDQYANGTWEEKSEEVVFADFRFNLSYFSLTSSEPSPSSKKEAEGEEVEEEHKTPTVFLDLMNFENDFPSRAHYLCRWYGLQQFFTLAPVSERQTIDSESRAKLLLSSAAMALGNSNCFIPVFVQLHQKWRKLFTGSALVRGAGIEFEMSQLKRFPPQYSHLAGLLEVFKAKLGCAYVTMPPVSVAVRFTYKLEDWLESPWPQAPPDFSSFGEGEVGFGDIGLLPFGACSDPISQIHLACTWPCLSEDMIVENSLYSDLDPLQAPQWTVRLQMVDGTQCLLGAFLQDFLKLTSRPESSEDLLRMSSDKDPKAGEISQVLSKLTEPVPALPSISNISSVVSASRSRLAPEDGTIPDPLLDKILFYLFPDAKSGSGRKLSYEPSDAGSDGTDLVKQLKSAPEGSLTYKLALALCQVNHSCSGLLGVAHLWQEVLLELRFRWENKHLLPGLEMGAPNMGSSLLHQKLQMLNSCIECKIKRESQGYGPDSISIHDDSFDSSCEESKPRKVTSIISSSDDEEEFFDADEESASQDRGGSTVDGQASAKSVRRSVYLDSVTHRAEGRLVPMKNEFLLASREQLYIPVTQEPSPMTEDMVEEHAEVLAKLGSSAEGSQIRARMQSACLVSDMESFKAANPGCTLEDFVRWYSPRDYLEGEEGGSGKLSQRMQIPGNMWVEAWQSARPVPARRQKRLFDDTKEAEKVLHWLSSLRTGQVVLHLMPCVVHAAVAKVAEECAQANVPNAKNMMDSLVARAAKVTRNFPMDKNKYQDLLRTMELAENVSARTTSLRSKFTSDHLSCPEQEGKEGEIESFVTNLLSQGEVPVRGGACGPAGAILHKMFITAQRSNLMIMEADGDGGVLDAGPGRPPTPQSQTPKPASSPEPRTASTVADFPGPSVREYILRAMVPRPAPYSKVLPQRMYCLLTEGDNRVAGAFTTDSTFQ